MNCTTLETSELSITVGNNEAGDGAHNEHRARYNGIWSLSSIHAPDNCFVPSFAGLNLEHLLDDFHMRKEGDGPTQLTFEPRVAPMHCERISEREATLHQDPTPLTGIESTSRFVVRDPSIVDFTFTATFTQPLRAGSRFGFFWASYINAPSSPALHFIDAADGLWSGLCPDAHGQGAGNTICHQDEDQPSWGNPDWEHDPRSMAHNINRRRFTKPLWYGRPGDGKMAFIQMFDQATAVRLTMSPSGGGHNPGSPVRNPAWDFQYIVRAPQPGDRVQVRGRVIYRPFTDLASIVADYDAYIAELATT